MSSLSNSHRINNITSLLTHADDSRGSKAFTRVCVCLSVCLFVCLSVKNEWTQSLQTWCRKWSWKILQSTCFWGQKVKCQGHRVTKCKAYRKRSSCRRAFAPLSSNRYLYRVMQKNGATLSHWKYSENSITELRGNWWTSAILYAEHSH